MDRRAFLKTGFAVGAASCHARTRAGEWRTYEVVTKVELAFPKGASRVWLPLPMRADTGGIAVSATNGPGRDARGW